MHEDQKVINLYQQGISQKEIAATVFGHKTIDRVSAILKAHPESGFIPHRRSGKNKYRFDENFFEAIDTEEKAYFFGFLAADGWIKYVNGNPTAVCLEIQQNDDEVLVAWRVVMGDQAPEIKGREQAGSKKSRLVFHSAKMARDLVHLGLAKNKTFTLGDITKAVPPILMRHFVRGVFDGDGCPVCEPYRLRMTFRGTQEFLSALQRVIPVKTLLVLGNQKWPTLYTSKHSAGCRLAYWMYEDAKILLNRKWNKCKSGFVLRRAKKTSYIGGSPAVGNAEGQVARQARNDYQEASL